tara:strand:+ start:33 stop:806 length:774 start_codon:yes stop_codon:yes gene_type:complete
MHITKGFKKHAHLPIINKETIIAMESTSKSDIASPMRTIPNLVVCKDLSHIKEIRRDNQGRLCVFDLIRFVKGIKTKTSNTLRSQWTRLRSQYPDLEGRCAKGKVSGCRQIQWVCDEDTACAIVSACTGIDSEMRAKFQQPKKWLIRRLDTRTGGLYALQMKYNPRIFKFGCSTKSLAERIANYKGFTAPCEVLLRHPMPGKTKQDIRRAEMRLLAAVEAVRMDVGSTRLKRLEGGNEWYEADDPSVIADAIHIFNR